MSEDESEKPILLHGTLDLNILGARSLPNMDLVSERVRRCFTVFNACKTPKKTQEASSHIRRKLITSDAYVTVCLSGATVARTRVISNSHEPMWKWNEHFKIPLAHFVKEVEFHVKDNDVFGADLIGIASVNAKMLKVGESVSDWFTVLGPYGKPYRDDSGLKLEMRFVPCENNPLYVYGMAMNPDNFGVRESYFPMRRGGCVTLYQDAHVTKGMLPEIELDNSKTFKQEPCWEDICYAILEAHHMVYIVGWSIYDKVKLIREPTRPLPSGGELTLGELLKYKSQEGVRVLLLVWDDKTSHDKFFLRTDGVMQTHDEETKKFFKHSSVHCVLSPRYASSKLSIFKQQVVGTLYTHHQKCVIVDSQGPGNHRKITTFIGGLDLCDGRYDTPEHRLYKDLNTVFENDYHNPTLNGTSNGPRQPWHDWHCKIEGPAAYDVLKNFEQRWKKASRWSEFGRRFKKIRHWHDDAIIKLERISWIVSPSKSVSADDPLLWVTKEDDFENWHVQVFRSIDSGSVKGFPKDVQEAEAQNLVCSKNLVIDMSIHTAYVQAIRSAQHFIYIENQYFIGSSYAWSSNQDAGADNLIPIELALKIASKIRAKERFAVYVVIPMWPEGAPSSAAVQEILFWQTQTMKMMYEIIAKELKYMKIENAHPLDYLNFYCLGNREEPTTDENGSPDNSAYASEKYRRFMIYVHAKGMIVDDEYVILGSANINQRSLAGSRDTEIAMGAYQSYHTWAKKHSHPYGQVYGYRMSLWAEHLRIVNDVFKEPENLGCVQTINKIAADNWSKYTSEEFRPLQGHLLKYPIEVGVNGNIEAITDQETFPDFGGKVLGARTTLPNALTT